MLEGNEFDQTELSNIFQLPTNPRKRTTAEISHKWHSIKIQMVQDLNEKRDKLTTKQDWLLAALCQLALAQVNSQEHNPVYASNQVPPQVNSDTIMEGIQKLQDLYVVDPLRKSDVDMHIVMAEERQRTLTKSHSMRRHRPHPAPAAVTEPA
jgi:hypothetical protein